MEFNMTRETFGIGNWRTSGARLSAAIRIMALGAVLCATPSALHAQEFKIADKAVQVHGFGTQGFVVTEGNNWLTMDTTHGSGAMTDFGLNASSQLTKKFRLGMQVYARNLGALGEFQPSVDWAFGDYRFASWLGVRAGKVKTTLGLYTDTQDLDFLHAFALMPQSVYPLDLRDANISHLGGDVYGTARIGRAGSISYTAYAGHRDDSVHSAYPYFLLARGTVNSTYRGYQWGGDVRWNAPVQGLVVGVSGLGERLHGEGIRLGLPNREKSRRPGTTFQYFTQYGVGNLKVDAEYKHFNRDHLIRNFNSEDVADVHAWYVSGSYRVMKRLELGTYYSRYTITSTFLGLVDTSLPSGHDYDKVISSSFDINRYVNVKVEGHFMDGYGFGPYPNGFYPQVNPKGFAPTTKGLVIKTGFNF